MSDSQQLAEHLQTHFAERIDNCDVVDDEVTIDVPCDDVHAICLALRDEKPFQFELLIDICGVDYLDYGSSEWQTESTTTTGFSRGVDEMEEARAKSWGESRFAVIYHLLSLTHNHRLRIRSIPQGEPPAINSVIDIWASADWFERETFDLFGIIFNGHPDLRRILTDYGFVGHPFRKDFPLIGNVEMRYDATLERCVYEPVSISPRTLVPKVIRDDQRYAHPDVEEDVHDA